MQAGQRGAAAIAEVPPAGLQRLWRDALKLHGISVGDPVRAGLYLGEFKVLQVCKRLQHLVILRSCWSCYVIEGQLSSSCSRHTCCCLIHVVAHGRRTWQMHMADAQMADAHGRCTWQGQRTSSVSKQS